MWMSDKSVGPWAPVGACSNLLSLSEKITGALQISLSVESRVNPSVLCQAFVICRAFRPLSGSLSSVGRPTLHQALRLLSAVSRSVGLSVFRRAFRPPSSSHFGDLSSVERSAPRWAFCPPSGCLPSIGHTALRRALRSLSCYPSSVGRSTLHRGLCLPSDSPPYVEFSILVISYLLSVSPSFEQFEDYVLITPTGTPSAILGMCPPNADEVLNQAIWGLCPTLADMILRRKI